MVYEKTLTRQSTRKPQMQPMEISLSALSWGVDAKGMVGDFRQMSLGRIWAFKFSAIILQCASTFLGKAKFYRNHVEERLPKSTK